MKVDQPLRVLHLEDNARDAELVREPCSRRAESSCDISASRPARSSLRVRSRMASRVPRRRFAPSRRHVGAEDRGAAITGTCRLFRSGALGEELAIEALKTGRRSYVLKERPSRLVPSVSASAARSPGEDRASSPRRRCGKRTMRCRWPGPSLRACRACRRWAS